MIRSGRDLFEPRLGLTLPLCGLHFVFFFLVQADPERTYQLFAFQPGHALSAPWSFLSYQFLHGGALDLFFGTMILYIFGMALETEWGTAEYTVFWLVATLGGSGAAFLLGHPLASGGIIVNVSMLFAYATLFPETVFYIFLILPVKVRWLATLTAAGLGLQFFGTAAREGLGRASVQVAGAATGFLFFWLRHRGRRHARKAAWVAVQTAKSAGSLRQDHALERRNRELFPRVEALRQAQHGYAEHGYAEHGYAERGSAERGPGNLPAELEAFPQELARLVVPGVKICKPVDFKGDKDGICVRCEGFAECSLRYVAGQPEEIVLKTREE